LGRLGPLLAALGAHLGRLGKGRACYARSLTLRPPPWESPKGSAQSQRHRSYLAHLGRHLSRQDGGGGGRRRRRRRREGKGEEEEQRSSSIRRQGGRSVSARDGRLGPHARLCTCLYNMSFAGLQSGPWAGAPAGGPGVSGQVSETRRNGGERQDAGGWDLQRKCVFRCRSRSQVSPGPWRANLGSWRPAGIRFTGTGCPKRNWAPGRLLRSGPSRNWIPGAPLRRRPKAKLDPGRPPRPCPSRN